VNNWPLVWSHGRGTVEATGGMLGPVYFRLPKGQEVQPFAVFPWAEDVPPPGQTPLDPMLARGRGEWPCVPFGRNPDPHALGWQHPIHGQSAHAIWNRVDDARHLTQVQLRYTYPDDCPVRELERHVWGIEGEAAIGCRIIVRVRSACRLPIGLHLTLRMPTQAGALQLHPGRFTYARSYPEAVEPGADILAPNQSFASLAAAPGSDGGAIDMSRFPLTQRSESLFQLCASDGIVGVTNREDGYRFDLYWDPRQLPSCLIWVSNAGRSAWPWSQRHYALGVEPVCAAFDQGVLASTSANPISESGIATSVALSPDVPWVTEYRMAVH